MTEKKKKYVFTPDGPSFNRLGRVDIRNVRCACGGLMFNVTQHLAGVTGVEQWQCDKCKEKRAKRLSRKEGS